MSTLPDRYLEVQLRFASAMARLTGTDLSKAVLEYTNFARRFGFWSPAAASTDPEWHRYATTLAEFANCRLTNLGVANHTNLGVGPFTAEVSGAVVRTHFVPADTDGLSPLHPSKHHLRASELVELFDQLRIEHPDVTQVHGASWLYSTKSYSSLFPARHIATATVRTDPLSFRGSSSWGQFLDYRGEVKDPQIDRFLDRLPTLDPASPWLLFPVPTLVVNSPLSNFDDEWRSRSPH